MNLTDFGLNHLTRFTGDDSEALDSLRREIS